MSLPLFRQEVLQARRAHWLGAIVLDQPPAAKWLAALVGLACMLLVAGLATGEYTRRTRVSGQLVPSLGAATVVSPLAGIVATVDVEEGTDVTTGTPLAIIRVPADTAQGDTGIAVADSLAQRRAALRDAYGSRRRRLASDGDALGRQQDDARRELIALDAEIATRERQRAIGDQLLARYRTLHAQQHVAELQLRQQEAAVLEQLAVRQALERQRSALGRQHAQLAQAAVAIPDQLTQLDADEARELAALDQEDAEHRARREASVPAPITGRIGTRLVQPGQSVQAGQALMTLLPADGELQAHLRVPGPAIGFVAEGDRVRLRYDAFPYQRFGHAGGRVERISRDALAGADGEPVYRIVVVLDRQTIADGDFHKPLRPGLVLQAELHGETRRLWQWALEPLRTLRAKAVAVADIDDEAGVGRNGGGSSGNAEATAATPANAGRRVLPRPAPYRLCGTRGPRREPMRRAPRCVVHALAADPGRTGVVGPPAIRGFRKGACDA